MHQVAGNERRRANSLTPGVCRGSYTPAWDDYLIWAADGEWQRSWRGGTRRCHQVCVTRSGANQVDLDVRHATGAGRRVTTRSDSRSRWILRGPLRCFVECLTLTESSIATSGRGSKSIGPVDEVRANRRVSPTGAVRT